jgi:uncharacterized LabA/DUF88 family protein
MLHTLHIRNLALLDHAEIRLAEGLTVVSGETGGGKSLLMTALKVLRGEKVPGSLVRHGQEELQVDGEFRLGRGERSVAVIRLVDQLCGGTVEDDLLLVTRIVDRNGKSRVRIGGRPATLTALRDLGAMLLEIHGQGDSRALMRPEIQCETLDAFAGTAGLRREFAAALQAARAVRGRLQALAEGERDRRQRLEFLRFQHQAISDLRLQDGELAELEQEHQVLSNLEEMRQQIDTALGALQDGEQSASDALARAARAVQEAAAIDLRLEDAAEQLGQAEELVADVCRKLQSGLARLDLDPNRLAAVQERLDELYAALKRFGPTELDLRRNFAKVQEELAAFGGADSDPAPTSPSGAGVLRLRERRAGGARRQVCGNAFDIRQRAGAAAAQGQHRRQEGLLRLGALQELQGGHARGGLRADRDPARAQSGKNSADIRMVVDALDLCYTKPHVDTFVIISGDSDFSPLVSKLRENAKTVIGVGVKNSTSDLLIANCDEFIFYDDLVRERGLLAERGEEGKIWGSMVKQALKRRKPGFNETYYGFRSFNELLEEAEAQDLVELERAERSGGYIVRMTDYAG